MLVNDAYFDPYPAGDHLVSPRDGYSHHAISLGWGWVIHFAGDTRKDLRSASIRVGTLAEFADGRPVNVVRYEQALPPEQVVANARSLLGRRGYSLLSRNCEHFAAWAKTGRWESRQVNNAIGLTLLAGLAYAVLNAEGGESA